MEDSFYAVSSDSTRQPAFIIDENLHSSVKESLAIFSSEYACSSSRVGNGVSHGSRNDILIENYIESDSKNHDTCDAGNCLSKRKDLVSCQSDASHNNIKTFWEKTRDKNSNFKESQCTEQTSTKEGTGLNSVVEADDSTSEESPQLCAHGLCSSSLRQQELGQPYAIGSASVWNHSSETLGICNSDVGSVSAIPDSSLTSPLLRDQSLSEEALATSSGFLPTLESDQRNGNLLNADVVSISFGILPSITGEISSHGIRRNNRWLFWDTFSRHSSRRNNDSPAIVTEDTDDLGSHGRWLLDFSRNLFDSGNGDLGYWNRRIHSPYERLWHSRFEILERLHSSLDRRRGRTTFCACGQHPNGTCSCETFMTSEESSIRASISRILMLAEALFEVLDEVHHQPVSLSLSMVSMPAPSSVVDSFPLKSHETPTIPDSGNDVGQCYICLGEYEDGDKIRVLPCHHEYHMSCIDKWLKEIHGVCPLCRADVCASSQAHSILQETFI